MNLDHVWWLMSAAQREKHQTTLYQYKIPLEVINFDTNFGKTLLQNWQECSHLEGIFIFCFTWKATFSGKVNVEDKMWRRGTDISVPLRRIWRTLCQKNIARDISDCELVTGLETSYSIETESYHPFTFPENDLPWVGFLLPARTSIELCLPSQPVSLKWICERKINHDSTLFWSGWIEKLCSITNRFQRSWSDDRARSLLNICGF